jgi:hypothetical protein
MYGRNSAMLALVLGRAAGLKFEAELAVKYSHSCLAHADSYVIVDHGRQFVKAALNGPTYVDLDAGPHVLSVSHPWCTFFDVHMTLEENGTFVAVANSTSTTRYPIAVRHLPTSEFGNLSVGSVLGAAPGLLMLVVGVHLLRKCLSSGQVQQAVKNAMDRAREQDLMQQQQAARK